MTNEISQINSFVLSNMAPQHPNHNRFAWKNWEAYTRNKANDKQVLIVITGVTGDMGTFVNALYLYFIFLHCMFVICSLGKPEFKVIIPAHWYKLLIWCENSILQAEYIFTKHEDTKTVSLQSDDETMFKCCIVARNRVGVY